MNKKDLINHVATAAELSKADAERAIDAVFSGISDAMKAKDTAIFVGFGTFKVEERAARTGRNPQTGAEIQIAAKNVVKFKASSALSDAVK